VAIDPAVHEGLAAYRRGDFHAAHTAWEHGAAHASGDRRVLLAALSDLAGALERQRSGLSEGAAHLLAATAERLGDLPAQVLGVDVDRLRDAVAGVADDPGSGLAAPPEVRPARAIPRWVLGRFLLFLALVAVGFVLFRFTPLGDRLNELMDRERLMTLRASLQARWWTAPLLVGLYAVLAPLGVPVSPFMLAGGAIFGTLMGSVLNFTGTFLGAAGSYFLARALGRDFVVHLVGGRLKRVERLIARRGFWPLVRIRFLPIPFPVVNYGAALAGVPAGLFLLTTAIGLVPANLVFTYFAAALVDAVGGERAGILLQMAVAVAALLALSFLPNLLVGRQRKKRYQELRDERRRRGR
jgi:uncharacterized membrane protein YdjX (TVP38/TMEM64 family)